MLPQGRKIQQDTLRSPDEPPDELHVADQESDLADPVFDPTPVPARSLAASALTAIGILGIVLSIVIGILGWRLIGDLGQYRRAEPRPQR